MKVRATEINSTSQVAPTWTLACLLLPWSFWDSIYEWRGLKNTNPRVKWLLVRNVIGIVINMEEIVKTSDMHHNENRTQYSGWCVVYNTTWRCMWLMLRKKMPVSKNPKKLLRVAYSFHLNSWRGSLHYYIVTPPPNYFVRNVLLYTNRNQE